MLHPVNEPISSDRSHTASIRRPIQYPLLVFVLLEGAVRRFLFPAAVEGG